MGRRVKTRAGKIDLVSLPLFGPVCFVEVKARNIGRDVAEAVAPAQRTRIARAASLYLDILPAVPLWPGAGRGSTSLPLRESPAISRMYGVSRTDLLKGKQIWR